MRLRDLVAAVAIGLSVPSLMTACNFVNTSTKVGSGQLYQSGDGRYDPYFSQVHQEQVAAASWPDDSKAARKAIVTALDLRPGSSNSTILSAAREKKGDAAVGRAVDETVGAERERARKLGSQNDKLEELLKRGEELKKQAVEDRKNLSGEKADEKVVAKKDELKREISAAVDAVESMLTDAKRGAKEADELARKLRGAWSGKDGEEPATKDEKRDEKKDEKKKPEPVAKKSPKQEPAATKKPVPKAAEAEKPPEEKPAKPAPTQKSGDEVFNP